MALYSFVFFACFGTGDTTSNPFHYPTPGCEKNCCTACCVATGGCGMVQAHQIHFTTLRHFIPSFTWSRQPVVVLGKVITPLPITSPVQGNFDRPAGLAWMDFTSCGWEARQKILRREANDRAMAEGLTVFVTVWFSVRKSSPRSLRNLCLTPIVVFRRRQLHRLTCESFARGSCGQ